MSEQGFKICPVCGKPKETLVQYSGRFRAVACWCDCDLKAREEELARHKQWETEQRRKRQFGNVAENLYSFADDDGKNQETTKQARKYLEALIEDDSAGLLIYGGIEQGKTFYAEAILNALKEQGRFVGVYRRFGLEIWNMPKFDALLIDDLDKFGSENEWKRLFDVVNDAYRSGQQLIITTNDDAQEMTQSENYLKYAIYSRILEKCYVWKLETGRTRNVKGSL